MVTSSGDRGIMVPAHGPGLSRHHQVLIRPALLLFHSAELGVNACPGFSQLVNDMLKGKAPPARTKSVSLDKAQKMQGFKMRVPKETLGGKLVEVNAEPCSGNQAIFLNYN